MHREFPVLGASAAPWRTDSDRDDSVIDPQVIGEDITGRVDIAYHAPARELEFLEIKEAQWAKAVFAEQQLINYVAKGNAEIDGVRKRWRARGHPYAHFDYIADMPTSRYTPPETPTEIDGRQVMLAWCRPGVIVFKALDVDNKELSYCGISDKGHTDAVIDRVLGQAEEVVVARALARRLIEMSLGPVNVKRLLRKVRERLRDSIRYLLEQTIKELCKTALELTLADVLDRFRRWLHNRDLLDALLLKLTPRGEGIELPISEAARRTAAVRTFALVVDALLGLAFAFI